MKGQTIGKLARDLGVSVETIRFYERLGILKKPPSPPRGWREYSADASRALQYVKQGQQLGFSLAEMKQLQANARGEQQVFCESVRSATRKKIRAIERQIEELRVVRRNLKDFLQRCGAKQNSQPCPIFLAMGSQLQEPVRRR